MYSPAANSEITNLTQYIDQQLAAIRASIVGLTEAQARLQPCRSVLSIGGLVKHVTYGMRGALERLRGEGGDPAEASFDEDAYAQYMSQFALGEGETGAQALADFDAVRSEYLAAVEATDPNAATSEPPQPWFGIFDVRPANARYFLVHHVEEMARHAGHADIIREQIDGMAVPAIVMSEEGTPGNDFFQPYVAAPGTIGAR